MRRNGAAAIFVRMDAPPHRSPQTASNESGERQLLQSLNVELNSDVEVAVLYRRILDVAVTIMRADLASLQMRIQDDESGPRLKLLASRGFTPAAVAYWEWVDLLSHSNCGIALSGKKRSIVPDVTRCEFMAHSTDLTMSLATGIRAVQSTPLVSHSGELIGMISTHWREPHVPEQRELGLFDILARQVAGFIERRHSFVKAPGNGGETAGKTVIVADDNGDAAEILAMFLRNSGHNVCVVRGGQEAIECAEELRPDVMVVDIGMPKINGYAVARAIRDQPWGRGIQLLALSGFGQEEDKGRAEAAGFDLHLSKPVDFDTLQVLLTSLPEASAD